MMNRKLTTRGRHTVLPIVGDTLVEVCLSICRLPALVFKPEDGGEAELTIMDRITLTCDDQERLLSGSKPGETFNPRELKPLVDLLGCQVADAIAYENGELRIVFSHQRSIAVVPSHGFEAWHFQYPRAGRPLADNRLWKVALTGTHGRLI